MNHTAKDVTNMLYEVAKSDPKHELPEDVIQYLQRCFTYEVAQHKGDGLNMARAVKNIPFRAFNNHDHGGEWCDYTANKDNYNYKNILGFLKNFTLLEALKCLFAKLSAHTEKLVADAFSQANESLNFMMSKKCPKLQAF